MRRLILVAALVGLGLAVSGIAAQVNMGVSEEPTETEVVVYAGRNATLVRQQRELPLVAGDNTVEFRWRDVTIDPASITLDPGPQAEVVSSAFPAGLERVLRFTVRSSEHGVMPARLSYLATGFDARVVYRAQLADDGASLDLVGLIELRNSTPDDVERARLRVVVGDVRFVEDVGAAASRKLIPDPPPPAAPPAEPVTPAVPPKPPNPWELPALGGIPPIPVTAPQALNTPAGGQYWIYTVRDLQRLVTGETREFEFLRATAVPVRVVYRVNQWAYGGQPRRVLVVKNDPALGLGLAPLPGGHVWLVAPGDATAGPLLEGDLGQIAPGQEAELDTGPSRLVTAKRTLMSYSLASMQYDPTGAISGYDRLEEYRVELRSMAGGPVAVEVFEDIPGVWTLRTAEAFNKVNDSAVVFPVTLAPGESRTLSFTIVRREGTRVRG